MDCGFRELAVWGYAHIRYFGKHTKTQKVAVANAVKPEMVLTDNIKTGFLLLFSYLTYVHVFMTVQLIFSNP